ALAVVTRPARDVMGHHHALARAEITGSGARLGHLADDLVSQDGRTGCGGAQLGEVRPAQPAAQDPEQELTGADSGRGASLETDLADPRVDGRPHWGSWP